MSTSFERLATVFLAVTIPVAAVSADWPVFQNGGRPPTDQQLPTNWSANDGVAWDTPIHGYGQSSPVVVGDRIYCTSVSGDNKDQLHVSCFSLENGELQWRFDRANSSPEENSNYVSRAAPTPVAGSEGVIAFFEGGNLLSLDPTGQVRWQRNLAEDYGPIKARHGLGASLEQDEERVFAWVEREGDPYLVALNKQDGETIWKARGLGSTSWSSPRLVPVGTGTQLVVSAMGTLAGLDPDTGKRLWTFSDIGGNSTPTPIPLGEGKFLIGATTGRGASSGGSAAQSNGVLAIRPTDKGDYRVAYVWRSERATSSFGSPLAFAGHAYFVNRSGVLYCLDLATGEEKYAKRTAGSVWATPIALGKHLYLFSKEGVTTVVEAGAAFRSVAENSLWGPDTSGGVLYAAAVSGQAILLRTGSRLYKVAP